MVKLPHGVQSYPEVTTLGELALRLREKFPDLSARSDLPPDLVEAIQAPWKPDDWVPEVSFMILHALARDVIFRDDEKFQQFCYDMAKESFSGKLVRAVMHFVSPTLLLMSAAKRWSLFKKGAPMKILKMEKNRIYVSLTYPPNMYHRSMLNGFAYSYKAAIDGTKAKNSRVEPEVISLTECRFNATWTFD